MKRVDFIVIGAGIAGASVAATLVVAANVVLLEQEDQPGFHSTGRSAALFSEMYGNAPVRALSRASRSFLLHPPAGFSEVPLVKPRGTLFVASELQRPQLEEFALQPDIAPFTRLVSSAEINAICPLIRPDHIVAAVHEPDSMDLEVHELHHGYLRQFRQNSGTLYTNARADAIRWRNGLWEVSIGDDTIAAPVIINAAGAWADEIAELAGVRKIGLQPYRRTAILVEPPAGIPIADWPLIIDIDEQYYVKPDAGLLLISPADETPMPPCDAFPEEIDVATGIYRAEQTMDLGVRSVRRSWAGLRSFVADRTPVVGFDPNAQGFFWLAGQGGYGIQTAPALARLAASLVMHAPVPADLLACGVDLRELSPARFVEPCLAEKP